MKRWRMISSTAALAVFFLVAQAAGQAGNRNFQYDPKAQPEHSLTFDANAGQQPGAECEVSVLRAELERPARLMLTSRQALDNGSQAKGTPSLDLQFTNRSMKLIASVDLVARVKVKESVYQLDSVTRSIPLHLADREASSSDREGMQRLQLAESVLGFESVAIQQVTYADGSIWKPESAHVCGYRSPGGSMRVAK